MARLRLFGPLREAVGTGSVAVGGRSVGSVLDEAAALFGAPFSEVLGNCAVWVNGEPAERDFPVGPRDEVAVLPPFSGG